MNIEKVRILHATKGQSMQADYRLFTWGSKEEGFIKGRTSNRGREIDGMSEDYNMVYI